MAELTVRIKPEYTIVTGSSGAAIWGSIGGLLSNQTDLQDALDAKLDKTIFNSYTGTTITGATNGLKLAGAGKKIGLGSPLTGNTIVSGSGFALSLGDTARFSNFNVTASNQIQHDLYFAATGAVIRNFMSGTNIMLQTVFGSKSGSTIFSGFDPLLNGYGGLTVYSNNAYPTLADQKLRISPKFTQLNIQSDGVPLLVSKLGTDSNVPLLSFKNRNSNNSATALVDILLGNNNGGLASGGTGSVYVGNLVANKLTGNTLTMIGIGQGALSASLITAQSGTSSIAIGTYAMAGATINDGDNIGIGRFALLGSTVERGNVAIGYEAGNVMSGSSVNFFNVAIGLRSFKNGSGTKNTGIGSESLRLCRGDYNTGLGTWTLSNTFGSYNTGVGAYAGYQATLRNNGSGNTYLGNGASYSTTTNNMVVIGNNFTGNLSNRIFLGNANQSTILGRVASGSTINVLTKEANGEITYRNINSIVTGTSSQVVTGATNLGTGNGIYTSLSNKKIQLKSLVAGANITLTPTATGITITGAGAGTGTVSGATNGLKLAGAGKKIGLGGTLTGTTNIGLGVSNLIFTGTTGTLRYGADFSAQYNVRSLVDKGYVTGITNTLQTKASIVTLTGTTLPLTYQSKASIVTLTGTTLPATYLTKSSFTTFSGTTLPAQYLKIANFNPYSASTATNISNRLPTGTFQVFSGSSSGVLMTRYQNKQQFAVYSATTAPATYQSKSSIVTLTGTTLPTNYARLNAAQTFSGKQTFSSTVGNAGLNIGSFSGDTTTPVNADLIYSTAQNDLRSRINGQWSNLTRPEIVTITGTTLTLTEAYRNKYVIFTSNSNVTVSAGNISVGFTVNLVKNGTGNISFNATGTTSLDAVDTTIYTLYAGAAFVQKSTTKWSGVGALGIGPLTGSATLNFPSTAGQSNSDLTITVTGAAVGDCVVLGVPNASIVNNSCFTAWVSATDTVTVRFNNYSLVSGDPASGTFTVKVLK